MYQASEMMLVYDQRLLYSPRKHGAPNTDFKMAKWDTFAVMSTIMSYDLNSYLY